MKGLKEDMNERNGTEDTLAMGTENGTGIEKPRRSLIVDLQDCFCVLSMRMGFNQANLDFIRMVEGGEVKVKGLSELSLYNHLERVLSHLSDDLDRFNDLQRYLNVILRGTLDEVEQSRRELDELMEQWGGC